MIRDIQLKCLNILDIFDNICRKYDIKYSLCGGSVVGAYLYQGCLPWDDDIDVMMTRENYDRFLDVVQQELPKGFSVQNFRFSENFSVTFTKIIDENTTMVQNDGHVSGVFLDIDVYDKVPHNWTSKVEVFLWKLSQISIIGKTNKRGIKPFMRNIVVSTLLRDKRKALLLLQSVVNFLGKRAEKYSYSEIFGAYCNFKPYRPSVFENYSTIKFEGKDYMIVRDYVEYLQTRYERTDFREPSDKQIAPHYLFVDLDIPYKEYIVRNSLQENSNK